MPDRIKSTLLLCLCLPFLSGFGFVSPEGIGVVEDRLIPCERSGNCVCSEYPGDESFIEPFAISGDPAQALETIRVAVTKAGGSIQEISDSYLWATFTTKWLRFVDDVQIRLDAEGGMVHVRSESRVGGYDWGLNRKRIEMIRQLIPEPAT